MKEQLVLILSFLFIFALSASATVYKWVDERGVVNFTDDYNNVPPSYRGSVVETNAPSPVPSQSVAKTKVNPQSGGTATQPPPIAQTLIPEGSFAIKLAEVLKIGSPQNEAEAESMLTSMGIQPRNGWIADYPVTPDIIGELQMAIGGAADTGKFAMKKDEAIKALQNLASQQGLPVTADEGQYAQTEAPPDYGDYSNPTVINNYYDQGPPIVTYYPPPPDYSYLYAWVPYPFWCSGFWFRGFFILHDFHKSIFVSRGLREITNHVIDPKTKRVVAIDPRTRSIRNESARDVSRGRGFSSQDAERDAGSIFMRSQERATIRNSAPSNGGRAPKQASPSRSSDLVAPRGRSSSGGPPVNSHWMQSQLKTGFRNMSSSLPNHQGRFGNRGGMTFPKPSFPSGVRSSIGGIHGGGFGNRSPLVGGFRGH